MSGILTPKLEALAAGLAAGLTQAEAFRRAFPHSKAWKDSTVWSRSSELAGLREVQERVDELRKKAAEANGVTVERVVAELVKVAFGDPRRLMEWGPDGVRLLPSEVIDEADAASVAEVSETRTKDGGSLKLKRHDKVKALELLGKHVGAFEVDNKQRNPLGNFNPSQFFADLFRKPPAE